MSVLVNLLLIEIISQRKNSVLGVLGGGQWQITKEQVRRQLDYSSQSIEIWLPAGLFNDMVPTHKKNLKPFNFFPMSFW